MLSPSGELALVHNGVISNDWLFREEYGGPFEGLADVDSSVLPAIIENWGVQSLEHTEGYAAVAWLDNQYAGGDMDYGTLHLLRLDFSPVAYTWLTDGSFVFASTIVLLARALAKAGLDHGYIFSLEEGVYFKVFGGVVQDMTHGHKMREDEMIVRRYSGATAGGHSSSTSLTTKPPTVIGSENLPKVGASFGSYWDDVDPDVDYDTDMALRAGELDDLDLEKYDWVWNSETKEYDKVLRESWVNDYRNVLDKPMVLGEDNELSFGEKFKDYYTDLPFDREGDLQGFYLADMDNNIEFYDTLEALETQLAWYSQLTLPENPKFPDADNKQRWTNFIIDMGQITVSDGMTSWLTDMDLIDTHESPAVHNLRYVRDGLISVIETL